MNNLNKITPFDFYCQKVIPLVYDDSLSYYEVLCKLKYLLNQVIESQNNIIDNFKNLLEWVDKQLELYVNNKLEEWLKDGTLADIINDILLGEINKKIKDIGVVNINQFPRLENENDDAPRFQRAFDYLKNQGGTILLNNESYIFETPSIYEKSFVTTYPNVNLIGVEGSVIELTSNSALSSLAPSLFRCLNMSNSIYKNFDVETCAICPDNDGNFYDVFYFKYDSDNVDYINLIIENVKTRGWAYQAVLNIGIKDETKTNFKDGILIKNCTIKQQGYITCANNIVYDNVVWDCNLDVLRPSYLNNAVQTPIKYSGKRGHCKDGKMINCKFNVTGTRLPFNPFEIFRSNVVIENMQITTSKKGVLSVGSNANNKLPDYGVSNEVSTLIIKNSNLNDISFTPTENGVIIVENCAFKNCNNLFFPCYEKSKKESENPICEIYVYNCKIENSVNRIVTNKLGECLVEMHTCTMYYDRELSPNGGISNTSLSKVLINNCNIYLTGANGIYLLNSPASDSILINNTTVYKKNETQLTQYVFNVAGEHKEIKITSCFNEALQDNSPFLRHNLATIEKLIVWNTNSTASEQ